MSVFVDAAASLKITPKAAVLLTSPRLYSLTTLPQSLMIAALEEVVASLTRPLMLVQVLHAVPVVRYQHIV